MKKKQFQHQLIIVFAHISAWGVFLSIPLWLLNKKEILPPPSLHDFPIYIPFILGSILISVFYINYLILVPRVLNRYSTKYYILSLLGLLVYFLVIISILRIVFFSYESPLRILATLFPFMLIVALSLSIRLLTDRSAVENMQKERENETLKSELSFLRSQISPHFLFNIMNNVVALSRIKPHLVETTLIKLSGLMRYMLYESDEQKITIDREIEYLNSYIELQKMRFGDTVNVMLETDITTNIPHQIEPMLLIPFIENAFKHGIGLIRNPEIKTTILLDDKKLIYNTINKYDPLSIEQKDSNSGIGLRNASRRLELLYDKKHTLEIRNFKKENDHFFEVNLIIDF